MGSCTSRCAPKGDVRAVASGRGQTCKLPSWSLRVDDLGLLTRNTAKYVDARSPEPANGRSSAPKENRATHDGAIFGIASAGMDQFVTCGEDKALCLNGGGMSGSFQNIVIYNGHSKPVSRAVCGTTTELIYSCSRDTTVRQWNRSGGDSLQVFAGHTLACSAVALSADERTICSGSRDTSILLWDAETGACKASAKVPRNLVTCLMFAPETSSTISAHVVVQGGEDLRLRVWDFRESGLKPALTIEGYTYFPLCLDISNDGSHVLTSSKGFDGLGCEAKLWDIRTGALKQEYTGHTQDTTACAFLPGTAGAAGLSIGSKDLGGCECSQMITTASKDETIKIYDQNTGTLLVDYVNPGCGGYTGLTAQQYTSGSSLVGDVNYNGDDDGTARKRNVGNATVLLASTITGGLYSLRLETAAEGVVDGPELRLRCTGFVQGNTIL